MYSHNQISVPGKAQSLVSVSLFYTSTNDVRLRNMVSIAGGGLQHVSPHLQAPFYAKFLTKTLLT